MKVLVISHTYVVGVNQQKVAALAALEDLEVGLVAPKSWKSSYGEVTFDQPENASYKSFPLKVYASGRNDRFLFDPAKLFQVIRTFRPDLIHVEEEPWSAACLQTAIFARTLGIPFIFFTWENLERNMRSHYKISQNTVFSLAAGALAGNQEASNLLQKHGFNKPIEVIPQLGVDLNYFPRKPLPEEFTIGFIGRLEEQKGILTLLDAYEKLESKPKLLLVGTGPLEQELESRIKNHRLEKVEIRKGLHHDQIPEALTEMSVLVLPSITTPAWKEQFGHVLIEAMASGRVVIGSNSGAIPEVIGDSGSVFQEKNASELANILEKLEKDKNLLEQLSEKAFQHAGEAYTHKIIAQKTLKFYKRIKKEPNITL